MYIKVATKDDNMQSDAHCSCQTKINLGHSHTLELVLKGIVSRDFRGLQMISKDFFYLFMFSNSFFNFKVLSRLKGQCYEIFCHFFIS